MFHHTGRSISYSLSKKKMGCSSFKHTYLQEQPCALTTQRISNSLRVTFLPIFQGHHSPRTPENSVTVLKYGKLFKPRLEKRGLPFFTKIIKSRLYSRLSDLRFDTFMIYSLCLTGVFTVPLLKSTHAYWYQISLSREASVVSMTIDKTSYVSYGNPSARNGREKSIEEGRREIGVSQSGTFYCHYPRYSEMITCFSVVDKHATSMRLILDY